MSVELASAQARICELEEELARVRAENRRLLKIHEDDRECGMAIFAAARLLVERDV